MSACFLDTCAVIDSIRRRETVSDALRDFDEPLISHVVLGELLAGCHQSQNPPKEIARMKEWLPTVGVIAANPGTPMVYGRLVASLKLQGKMIPTNDAWIAAPAIQCSLPLVSSDPHFERIPGLQWVRYFCSQ